MYLKYQIMQQTTMKNNVKIKYLQIEVNILISEHYYDGLQKIALVLITAITITSFTAGPPRRI